MPVGLIHLSHEPIDAIRLCNPHLNQGWLHGQTQQLSEALRQRPLAHIEHGRLEIELKPSGNLSAIANRLVDLLARFGNTDHPNLFLFRQKRLIEIVDRGPDFRQAGEKPAENMLRSRITLLQHR